MQQATQPPLGIMAALSAEIAEILSHAEQKMQVQQIAQRDYYYYGQLHGRDCVIVLARIGKVAAAATATTLINEFKVGQIIFTGVAGGINAGVNVGDVVIANSLSQYDIDASPLFPKYEVPLLHCSRFASDTRLNQRIERAARLFLQTKFQAKIPASIAQKFLTREPKIHYGEIISGDTFITDANHVATLQQDFPQALCVEMEGAAVAQICYEQGIPFAIIRIISDYADGHSAVDFSWFLQHAARFYSAEIIQNFLLHQ